MNQDKLNEMVDRRIALLKKLKSGIEQYFISEGLSDEEIAEKLNFSVEVVEMMRKPNLLSLEKTFDIILKLNLTVHLMKGEE